MSKLSRSFLERYERELRRTVRSRRLRRKIIDEADAHLRDCCDALERNGCPHDEAERLAVQRFGGAERLAAAWGESSASFQAFGWLLACTTGIAGGLTALLAIGPVAGSLIAMALIVPFAGLLVGAGLGVGQSISLRGDGRWVALTAVAAAIGLTASTWLVEIVGFQPRHLPHEMIALAMIGSVTGAFIGFLQSLAPWVRRVSAWRLGTAAGGGIGCIAGGLAATLLFGDIRTSAGLLMVAAAAGLSIAAFTAPLLRRQNA